MRDDPAHNVLQRVILLCDALDPLRTAAKFDPRIRNALEIVAERNDTPISVANLGHAAGLSRSRFTTLFFSEQMSFSPQAFIESVLLERAAQFLRMSRRPVARVAERSGFTNAFCFPMRFRRRHGVSPSGYRAMIERLVHGPSTGKPSG